MTRIGAFGAFIQLSACEPKDSTTEADYARGTATACLDAAGAASRAVDDTVVFDLTGTVVSDEVGSLTGDLHPCYASSRVFTLLASDGVTYKLGYGIRDADAVDITPALDVEADASVYLHFVSVESFGQASGFVIQDTDSVIGALDVGTWGSTIHDGDFPGLSVEVGDIDGFGSSECGDTEGYALNFIGDAARALTPVEDKLITVGTKAYSGFAISAWEYSENGCLDTAGEVIWGAFR